MDKLKQKIEELERRIKKLEIRGELKTIDPTKGFWEIRENDDVIFLASPEELKKCSEFSKKEGESRWEHNDFR